MRAALALVMLLAGCASYSGQGLVPGRSNTAEVEALMGAPAQKLAQPGGGSVWFYPRGGRQGWDSYAVRIGADGVMRSIEQRWTVENMDRLVPGLTTEHDVLELLGPPYETARFEPMKRTVWGYHVRQVPLWWDYWLRFSDDGVLREVVKIPDYQMEGDAPAFASLR